MIKIPKRKYLERRIEKEIFQEIPVPKIFTKNGKQYIKCSFSSLETRPIELRVENGILNAYTISFNKAISKASDKILALLKLQGYEDNGKI